MYYLIYVSSAVEPFSDPELLKLLEISQRNNHEKEITGLLLYDGGNFMQLLEGSEIAVKTTHERIASDPRHRGLITLMQGDKPEREFPDWTMGFRKLDSEEVRALPGFSEFMNLRLNDQEYAANPSKCLRLLMTFKKNVGAAAY